MEMRQLTLINQVTLDMNDNPATSHFVVERPKNTRLNTLFRVYNPPIAS